MIRKFTILILLIALGLFGVITVNADESDTGRPWKDHAKPFDFVSGNLIDNHQQMKLQNKGWLHGFIYIQFTGEFVDGFPVARRADCTNPSLDCSVGWEVSGVPVSGAKLVQKGPRLWELASLPADPEFVHFHWMGTPKKPCGLTVGAEYSGYLFKRTAVTTFYWLGGNPNKEMGRLVTPGVDLHSNINDLWTGDGDEGEDEGECAGH